MREMDLQRVDSRHCSSRTQDCQVDPRRHFGLLWPCPLLLLLSLYSHFVLLLLLFINFMLAYMLYASTPQLQKKVDLLLIASGIVICETLPMYAPMRGPPAGRRTHTRLF